MTQTKTTKFKPVTQEEVLERVKDVRNGRVSKGSVIISEFLTSGESAATVDFESAKERDAVMTSIYNLRGAFGSDGVWTKKQGGATGTELLFINLAKADAATKKAYKDRPSVGRPKTGA